MAEVSLGPFWKLLEVLPLTQAKIHLTILKINLKSAIQIAILEIKCSGQNTIPNRMLISSGMNVGKI